MSTVIERSTSREETSSLSYRSSRSAGPVAVVGVLALVAVALAVWATVEGSGGRWIVVAVAVGGWAGCGFVVVLRRGTLPLGPLMALVAVTGGVAVAGSAAFGAHGREASAGVRLVGDALLVAVLFHVAMSVPSGRLVTPWRRVLVGAGYVAAVALVAIRWNDRGDVPVGALVVLGAAFAAIAAANFVVSCRAAGRTERAALQWMGWGVVTTVAVTLFAWGLDALVGWPGQTALIALAASVLVPLAFVASTFDSMLALVDRLLVHTFVTVGLVALVGLVYFFVVVGLGRVPDESERSVLGLSMVAAGLAAVLALPARRRLEQLANQRVYGERRAPDDALKAFATRMSRVVPMDELLLQLAESLRKTMALTAAEIWTGADGSYERVASVPDRGEARLSLSGEELTVVARAHVSGNAWVQVWMPSLLVGRRDERAAGRLHRPSR